MRVREGELQIRDRAVVGLRRMDEVEILFRNVGIARPQNGAALVADDGVERFVLRGGNAGGGQQGRACEQRAAAWVST